MKLAVTRFKTLTMALKELEPFIRNGQHLQTGERFKRFGGLLSRELLVNWLICVTANWAYEKPERFNFSSDPNGGDGIIRDSETEATSFMEHVMVPKARDGRKEDLETRVLAAIDQKQKKGGAAYAEGKTLVIFVDAGEGMWTPNRIARRLPENLHFADVWAAGLIDTAGGEYVYAVTRLDVSQGNAPIWSVRIRKTFDAWEVEPIQ
jgi:hypothetical protein